MSSALSVPGVEAGASWSSTCAARRSWPRHGPAWAGRYPSRVLKFSQRLSADHLVFELHQDERGFGDVADRGRADHDVLQGAPALGHEREAAFSLVAHGT